MPARAAEPRERGVALLRAEVARAGRIVAFTGAGLSTECGVPDYRSPGSPWLAHAPIGFADFLADPEARREAWRRKFAMDDIYAGAMPGRGHDALARLHAEGRLACAVTQNIDGLQQAAGMPAGDVVELHGNGTYAACLACEARHELSPIREALEREGRLPACRACGGIVKSASIAFGQAIRPETLQRALDAVLACDLLLVIGSSLRVRPAARLPEMASRNGARVVVVNREPGPFDDAAVLVVHADIGGVFDQL